MQSRLPLEGHILVLRTNYIDQRIEAFLDLVARETGLEVVVAYDVTHDRAFTTSRFKVVEVGHQRFRSMGLHITDDVMWRCGDYCVYAARALYPDAQSLWMIEPDVYFNWGDQAAFFKFFADFADVDFLVGQLVAADPASFWYGAMKPFTDTVYKCLFPVTRFSGRAVDYLYEKRKSLDPRASPMWPNDEVFTATTLMDGGFVCKDLNDFGRDVCTRESFVFEPPFTFGRLSKCEPDGLVYHPVLSGERFYRKVVNRLGSQSRDELLSFDFAGYYKPAIIGMVYEECGPDIGVRFEEKIARTLDVQSAARKIAARSVGVGWLELAKIEIFDAAVWFAVSKADDYIASYHKQGRFYETVELAFMRSYFPKGGTFIDVGAHHGNHSIFAAKFCGAARVIPIEPQVEAGQFIRLNVSLNALSDVVDTQYLGLALWDEAGHGELIGAPGNSGGTYLRWLSDGIGEVPGCACVTGDSLFEDVKPDCIKIDVGSVGEIAVVRGLAQTLRRWKPMVIVNAPTAQHIDILNTLFSFGYEVLYSRNSYGEGESVILVSKTARSEVRTS